jgi:hypothetical protein
VAILLRKLRAWITSLDRLSQAALFIAVVIRIWLALDDHSVFWPDEIYQSLEPAHRAAFGYGLIPWEFRDGARSWAFPAILAPALWIIDAVGIRNSLVLVSAARMVMLAFSIAGIAACIEYARRICGKPAGVLAAVSLALFPPLLVFSHRTMQENASAPLVAFIPLLLLTPGKAAARNAGFVAGLATLLRFQCGLVAFVFFASLLARRRWLESRAYAVAAATILLGGGLLDLVTWGTPFHSFIAYVRFNLLQGGASTFGVEPPGYFVTTLWSSAGPVVVLFGLGLLVALARVPATVVACLTFLALHSAIPHKEFRFLVPVLPLMVSASAIGLAMLVQRTRAPVWVPPAAATLIGVLFVNSARAANYERLGQYAGTQRAASSPWNTDEELNLLLSDAGSRDDLCGMLVLGARAAFTGGYTYLHRPVPLLYRHRTCEDTKTANYVIGPSQTKALPASYRLVKARGAFTMWRRDGRCAPPPAEHDEMLEGADDMGLGRAPIRQPDRRELRIAAGSNSAAFVRGFGHGEHIECRNVRWATARSAEVAFELEPADSAYTLLLTAQPHYRTVPQAMRVRLNGAELAQFELSEGWEGYQANVEPSALRRGKNTLLFAFGRTTRAEGDDQREFAALFDQIVIAPVVDTVTVDVGTSDGRLHLGDGFSGDELSGRRTFAWSSGLSSQVRFNVGRTKPAQVLRITAAGYRPVAPVTATVKFNGELVGTVAIPNRWVDLGVLLPPSVVRKGANVVELGYSATGRPRDFEAGSQDDRQLAVMFDHMALDAIADTLVVDLGNEDARPHLLVGFGANEKEMERSVVWSEGPLSRLALFVSEAAQRPYVLRVVARAFEPATPQEMTIVVNDKEVGKANPTPAWAEHSVTIPDGVIASGTNTFEFRYGRSARPKDSMPTSNDDRELAVRFDAVTLTPSNSATLPE